MAGRNKAGIRRTGRSEPVNRNLIRECPVGFSGTIGYKPSTLKNRCGVVTGSGGKMRNVLVNVTVA